MFTNRFAFAVFGCFFRSCSNLKIITMVIIFNNVTFVIENVIGVDTPKQTNCVKSLVSSLVFCGCPVPFHCSSFQFLLSSQLSK